ncbi:hypothetical protein ACFQQB_03160 [Nonomuraea rubra]
MSVGDRPAAMPGTPLRRWLLKGLQSPEGLANQAPQEEAPATSTSGGR